MLGDSEKIKPIHLPKFNKAAYLVPDNFKYWHIMKVRSYKEALKNLLTNKDKTMSKQRAHELIDTVISFHED